MSGIGIDLHVTFVLLLIITLWPIGGIARLERIPEDPRQEIVP